MKTINTIITILLLHYISLSTTVTTTTIAFAQQEQGEQPTSPQSPPLPLPPQVKPLCRNTHTIFSESTKGWKVDTSPIETFAITPDGLQMNLAPPKYYQRLIHALTTLPYNSHIGHGPTLNSTTYMLYGRFSATVKASKVGGAITAVILIADGGDEIDFELLGSEKHTAQTNYFWGIHPMYTVNGGFHNVSGENIYDEFHTYTVDWSPERIVWTIDEDVVRIKEREQTCEGSVCKFPSNPARVQIGFWDGSFEFGTAEWSHGPIDWEEHMTNVTSILKEVKIECNPEYNEVVEILLGDEEPLSPTEPKEDGSSSENPSKWKPKPNDQNSTNSSTVTSSTLSNYFFFFITTIATIIYITIT
ncbi:hypothetical protein INT45_006255 [Circinella minor]|uniref:GH16 domain-containing protein n=1 Tax=Circinella minor TaxID=1195481 RepID=A0A8H7RWD0_9FUNG|nr:hypothetical protein INT45_006255 [Circinella minor]